MALFDTIRAGASGAVASFEVERSLRFNDGDSAKLNRTFGTNSSNTTKTLSFWMKRSHLGSYQTLFGTTSSGNIESRLQFTNTDELQYVDRDSSSGVSDINKVTERKFRDVGAWYHIVLAFDTTNGTAEDRVKIYINGVRETTFPTNTNPSSSYAVQFFRSSVDNFIGANNASDFFDGYLTEINFSDGQALTPSSFGETDTTTGQWNPIDTSGLTFGTNGFYLNFSDNSGTSATTLGKDYSGNGNNFTPNNFSVAAGVENDSYIDTPTNNFCILNPTFRFSGRNPPNFFNATLEINNTGGGDMNTHGTFAVKSGKYYFEGETRNADTSGGSHFIGIQEAVPTHVSQGLYRSDGRVYDQSGSSSDSGTTYDGTKTIGVAFDADTGKVWFAVNNTWISSGDPANGNNPALTYSTTNHLQPAFAFDNTSSGKKFFVNFGQRSFTYTPPTGYVSLSSANLPDPTILLPNEHFNTLLYTGNDSSDRDITGVGFQPDWLWIKNRSQPDNHMLSDAIRGANTTFFINTDGEDANNSNGHVNSFLADGFNVDAGAGGNVNENNENYVSWNWYAGGSTVTNNDGTISSQVRANPSAGFSLVGYQGTGNNSDSVGHGLGVTPDAVFIKQRIGAAFWMFESSHTYNGRGMHLDLNNGSNTAGTDTTSRSSTVVTFIDSGDSNRKVNFSGSNYLMYCFSSVSGYSKIGQYTGNGSTDGTFVFTGFRPAMIILKRTNSAAAWIIHDDKRAGFNQHNDYLQPDDTTAESDGSGGTLDILSNGFKLRSTPGTHNGSGDTYTYLAFAQASFKYARAR